MSSLYILILISLLAGFAVFMFMMWGIKRSQFDDPEGAKYRMLDDEQLTARSVTNAEKR
ncbi:MAG: cbb3-type cytochrome oxidase assembly protein CcoS [Deferribacteraceae bacterium]|jgi:cbb3-type cytochrome oxidase maturation protein|nr:cbb3-type cytochrome oxidase assembly protein CcoS [Deferribacteraceae bacterium]